MAPLEGSPLLAVPPEIREHVYRLLLHPDANRLHHPEYYTSYDYSEALVLFQINKQIYLEARKIFRDLNIIARVETPWPEARRHIATEGVPILAYGRRASEFQGHHLTVSIDAPEANISLADGNDDQRFMILVDDLPKFTHTWFYSNLSYPGLNPQLRLTLTLRVPWTEDWEEKRMTKALQRRLLLPFGEVHDLHSTIVKGDPKPFASVENEMRAKQLEPQPSPEQCLREATRLKLEGNEELKAGRYENALEVYRQAWKAMHIVVKGTKRSIHGDRFFDRILHEAPYTGKDGQQERLILRVQLVANTCHALLQLKAYDDCIVWGMRSIEMLRKGIGIDDRADVRPEEEAMLRLPAADQMGKIYYRTALALKATGQTDEARRLLRVAHVYLPHEPNVQKELAACALRL